MKAIYFSLCVLLFFSLTRCQNQPPERSLQEIADELNKKCPQMIDSETRLDGLEINNSTATIIYKYSLVNLMVKQVDTVEFKRALWPGILSLIKVSPDMKRLRDQKTRFEYDYRDKQGQHIYTFKIIPTDYNS